MLDRELAEQALADTRAELEATHKRVIALAFELDRLASPDPVVQEVIEALTTRLASAILQAVHAAQLEPW
jgi:hypothetical protein